MAFSDSSNEFDYLKRLYNSICLDATSDLKKLQQEDEVILYYKDIRYTYQVEIIKNIKAITEKIIEATKYIKEKPT